MIFSQKSGAKMPPKHSTRLAIVKMRKSNWSRSLLGSWTMDRKWVLSLLLFWNTSDGIPLTDQDEVRIIRNQHRFTKTCIGIGYCHPRLVHLGLLPTAVDGSKQHIVTMVHIDYGESSIESIPPRRHASPMSCEAPLQNGHFLYPIGKAWSCGSYCGGQTWFMMRHAGKAGQGPSSALRRPCY